METRRSLRWKKQQSEIRGRSTRLKIRGLRVDQPVSCIRLGGAPCCPRPSNPNLKQIAPPFHFVSPPFHFVSPPISFLKAILVKGMQINSYLSSKAQVPYQFGQPKGSSSTKEGWDITKEAIVLNRPLKPYERTTIEEMVL